MDPDGAVAASPLTLLTTWFSVVRAAHACERRCRARHCRTRSPLTPSRHTCYVRHSSAHYPSLLSGTPGNLSLPRPTNGQARRLRTATRRRVALAAAAAAAAAAAVLASTVPVVWVLTPVMVRQRDRAQAGTPSWPRVCPVHCTRCRRCTCGRTTGLGSSAMCSRSYRGYWTAGSRRHRPCRSALAAASSCSSKRHRCRPRPPLQACSLPLACGAATAACSHHTCSRPGLPLGGW